MNTVKYQFVASRTLEILVKIVERLREEVSDILQLPNQRRLEGVNGI